MRESKIASANGSAAGFEMLMCVECMALNRTAVSPRDGPDQTSPQLGQFSGSSPQEAVSSMSNHILLKFHSDFSTSGFFVLRYHGEHLLSGLRIHEGLILI